MSPAYPPTYLSFCLSACLPWSSYLYAVVPLPPFPASLPLPPNPPLDSTFLSIPSLRLCSRTLELSLLLLDHLLSGARLPLPSSLTSHLASTLLKLSAR